jgi:hypothetical protein
VVIDQLVTLWAKEHQVGRIIDLPRTCDHTSTRTLPAESHDVRHLTEVALSERERVLEEKLVASVELAPAACAHEK